MPAAVAIAVVSWKTRDLLDACLRSLQPEHAAGRAEVWVVDNGSSDGSADLVRDHHPWVALVEQPDNPGFGAAVNAVASQTSTPWIAADVLEHLRGPESVLAGLVDVLAPGGTVIVSLPNVRYWETFRQLGVRGTWPRRSRGSSTAPTCGGSRSATRGACCGAPGCMSRRCTASRGCGPKARPPPPAHGCWREPRCGRS